MGKDLKFTVSGDTKPGIKSLDDLAKSADKAGVSLDETQTTTQQLAAVIAGMADASKAELEGIASAADAMRAHLGEAAEGMNLEEAVVKMRRLGVSFEEIEADAESLADALRHVDDVNRSIDSSPLREVADRTARARTETDDLSHSARGANSALANMIGNSAQDVGQFGGLIGSVGVGIGQMAEYAADATLEGEKLGSALGSMAKIAGPIAVLSLAVKAVGDYMGGIKAEKALRAEIVDKFFEGFREGKTAVQIVNEELERTGAITAQVSGKGGLLSLGTEAVDLAQLYRDAGIEYDKFLADLTDPSAVQTYKDQSIELIDTDNKRAVLFHDLADGLDDYQNGIGKAALKQKELEAWTSDSTIATQKAAAAEADAAAAFLDGEMAAERVGEAAQQAARRHEALEYASGRAADSQRDMARAAAENDAALQELLGTLDRADAVANLTSSFDDMNQAAVDAFEAQVEANKAAAEGADDAVEKQAAATEASAAYEQQIRDSKREVIDFATNVLKLPASRVTEIVAEMDAGQLSKVEADLLWLARTRDAYINVHSKYDGGGATGGGKFIPNAKGGRYNKPTLALIGETYDDEVVLNLDDPESMRPLLAQPGVLGKILGALGNGSVVPMAQGGLVTRGSMGDGQSVELRGIDLGSALQSVFAGYTSLLSATDGLTEAQHRLNDSFHENGKTLDVNTDEGRANRDVVERQWEAVKDLAEAQFEQGASVGEVTEAMRSNLGMLRSQLEYFGMSAEAIDDYLGKLGATPAAIDGVTEAIRRQQDEAAVEKQINLEDYLYERQQLSADRYLVLLKQRQDAEKFHGDAWFALQRKIDQVEADRLAVSKNRLKEWADAATKAFDTADDLLSAAGKVEEGLAGVQSAVWQDGLGAGSSGRKAVLDQLNAIAEEAKAAVAGGMSAADAQRGVDADLAALRQAVVAGGGSGRVFDSLLSQSGRASQDFARLLAALSSQERGVTVNMPVTITGADAGQVMTRIRSEIELAVADAARRLRAA